MVAYRTLELFLGAWGLINKTRTSDGVEVYNESYGNNPSGVIMYTPSGYMSALLTTTDPEDRPQGLTLPAQDDQTDHDWANIGRHTLAYSGPFFFNDALTVNESAGQIVHGPIRTTTLPRFVGSLQRRNFTFHDEGQTMRLVGDLGNGIVDTLYWGKLDREVTFGGNEQEPEKNTAKCQKKRSWKLGFRSIENGSCAT